MAELISTKTVRYNDNMPDFSLIAVGGDKKGLAYFIPITRSSAWGQAQRGTCGGHAPAHCENRREFLQLCAEG